MTVLLLVLPDFLLIALGWLLLHRFRFPREFFNNAEKLIYFVLFPALLFHSITQAPGNLAQASGLIQATLALMAIAVGLSWLAVPILRPDSRDHGSVAQCGFRFNTYIGLSIAGGLAGGAGQTLMAVIVGFAIPVANIAAVHALARRGKHGFLKEISRNPFVLATLLALAVNLTGTPVPAVVQGTLKHLAASAIGLGLLCVGATLSLTGARQSTGLMSWMLAVRLLAVPLAALGVGALLDLPPDQRLILLLFGALPTASAAHVLAARMGGNGALTALTMSVGTVLSAVTIPLWILVGTHWIH